MTHLKQILRLQQHPNQRSRTAWNFAQLGLLALPLSQFLGILALLLACGHWRQEYSKIVRRPLNWGLAVISIWLVISAGFAYNRLDAFLGLFNFVPFFLFFAGFSSLIQTPAQLRQLAWILVLTSVPVTVIGLGQLFLGWTAHFKFLWIVVDWAVESAGNPPGRMASVFMYANVLAGYSAIVFILGLGLWFETYHRMSTLVVQEGMKSPNDLTCKYPISPSMFHWGFLNVALIGNLVALILTNSRNAWAIAIFASLAFALYQGWRWLVAGVAGVAGSVLGAAFGPSPVQQWLRAVVPAFFWARLTDQLYPDRPVVLLRKTQWQFAWALTQQRPWTGWGLRNFTPLYQAQMQVWLGHPHNFLLMLTAETGIPGAVLLCGWVSWIVYQGVLVLHEWSDHEAVAASNPLLGGDRLIFFSYLIAFLACILFNTVDVTIFDLRLNILGWLLLSAICGVIYQRQALNRQN